MKGILVLLVVLLVGLADLPGASVTVADLTAIRGLPASQGLRLTYFLHRKQVPGFDRGASFCVARRDLVFPGGAPAPVTLYQVYATLPEPRGELVAVEYPTAIEQGEKSQFLERFFCQYRDGGRQMAMLPSAVNGGLTRVFLWPQRLRATSLMTYTERWIPLSLFDAPKAALDLLAWDGTAANPLGEVDGLTRTMQARAYALEADPIISDRPDTFRIVSDGATCGAFTTKWVPIPGPESVKVLIPDEGESRNYRERLAGIQVVDIADYRQRYDSLMAAAADVTDGESGAVYDRR